ncbi:MAG: hypothetical protein ACSLE0_17500 [Chitinophagaceae bacterium]
MILHIISLKELISDSDCILFSLPLKTFQLSRLVVLMIGYFIRLASPQETKAHCYKNLIIRIKEEHLVNHSKNIIEVPMQPATIQDLKKVIVLIDLPDEHLQWVLDHSVYVEYEEGEIIMKTGEVAEFMMFIVEGIISFYMDKSGTLVHYFDFANDVATGGASGLLPYSRMKTSPGTSFAVGKLRGFRLHKDH